MAEVGQKLGSGSYWLSAVRGQGRPGPGSLLVNRIKQKSTQDQREVQPVSKSRATQRESGKLPGVRTSECQQENGTLRPPPSLELDSSRFIECVQTKENLQSHSKALYLSARLQPVLQEKLLPGRRTSCSIGADTFRSPQQLRAFCTVMFILAEQGSERPGCGLRLTRLKLPTGTLQAFLTSRSYSLRNDSRSKDAPVLYRSRTAYYDILKVSPAATQSQIKTAYYKQSFIYHPDKNPGDGEATQRFSVISEAYTVLGNVSLRRKYDRGILIQSDIQSAGRPSSKETTGRSTGSPQQQHQHRVRQFSQAGGKTVFDFDAFYQAHYGEQLQRERDSRARKQRTQEKQKENFSRWRQGKVMEMTVATLLAMAGILFINISRP